MPSYPLHVGPDCVLLDSGEQEWFYSSPASGPCLAAWCNPNNVASWEWKPLFDEFESWKGTVPRLMRSLSRWQTKSNEIPLRLQHLVNREHGTIVPLLENGDMTTLIEYIIQWLSKCFGHLQKLPFLANWGTTDFNRAKTWWSMWKSSRLLLQCKSTTWKEPKSTHWRSN